MKLTLFAGSIIVASAAATTVYCQEHDSIIIVETTEPVLTSTLPESVAPQLAAGRQVVNYPRGAESDSIEGIVTLKNSRR